MKKRTVVVAACVLLSPLLVALAVRASSHVVDEPAFWRKLSANLGKAGTEKALADAGLSERCAGASVR